ncbi:MAG: SecE/Sec61-gamma subunit of protein translocation complex [Gaiellaceae bacterium]|nr:SecE/Sec61-gamma subunit of protein translocation complex [Gaiellaceae bacterium]
MARQTRAQRRARREQMTPGSEAALPGGPPAPPRRPTARAAARPEPAREPRAARSGGARGFVAASWAELKKVEWPNQSQLIQGVAVVLIACVIVGIFLYSADLVFKRLVQDVFL